MSIQVLLIDDDQEFLDILSERLILYGVDVQTAASGQLGLDWVKKAFFDIIILDLQMPEMDGLQTLQHLKGLAPALPVILLTGHATISKGVQAMKCGAVDVLEKPVNIRVLEEKIQEIVVGKQSNHTQRMTGQEALEALLTGNKRFVSGKLEHPNRCEESRKGLIIRQEPIAAVLACADSRVPPVIMFDQGLGDLFEVRVAGNVLNDQIIGSLEYAVAHLHTPLIMVMGHACCGAIGAVAQGVKLDGHIASLTPSIDAALKQSKGTEGDRVNNAAKELARATAKKIAESEPIIADFVKAGKVLVVAGYYDLTTGTVTVL